MSNRLLRSRCFGIILFALVMTGLNVRGQEASAPPTVANPGATEPKAPETGSETPVAQANATVTPPATPSAPTTTASTAPAAEAAPAAPIVPWEYRPYNVMIWVVADQPERLAMLDFESQLANEIELGVHGAWEYRFGAPPPRLAGLVYRDFEQLSYDQLAGDDLVLAVNAKPEAGRPVRSPKLAGDLLSRIPVPIVALERLQGLKDEGVQTMLKKAEVVPGSADATAAQWLREDALAMVLPRGVLSQLPRSPEPRIIDLPLDDQFIDISNSIDKLLIVRIQSRDVPVRIQVREYDGFLRLMGPVSTVTASTLEQAPRLTSQAMLEAFSPLVRIENAGRQTAKGRVRAVGLVRDPENSPLAVHVGDTLQPWQRKDDRNGRVDQIALIDWTYGVVSKLDGAKLEMNVYSGRSGGLQAKETRRTQRVAIRTRKSSPDTNLRLHARGNANSPMAGYEVYEKHLESGVMTLIGRTNWDGRIVVAPSEEPLRLLYVKNGGSVLARLPVVPGLMAGETADLIGDDTRLRAEAYLKGIENTIIDMFAIRQLLAARIRMRLQRKNAVEARELYEELRNQPNYSTIAEDMERKRTLMRSANKIEQGKIDTMFSKTRELAVAQLSEKLIRDLELEVVNAERGVFPEPPPKETRGP